MTDDPYRSAAKVVSPARVEADENIAVKDLALGPLAPLFFPRELRERIEALRPLESDESQIELAEKLEEATDFIRIRQHELGALPSEHWSPTPLDDRWGPTGMENEAPPVMDEVRTLVSAVDPAVEVTRVGPRITARFTVEDVPITWTIDLFAAGGGTVALHTGTEHILLTHSDHKMGVLVTDDTPKLKIRPETLADDALKLVGIRSEAEIGDKLFDHAFFVDSDPLFAKAMLTGDVRAAFLTRGEVGSFTYWLEGSVAELNWTGGLISGLLTPKAFPSSVALLVATRRALSALELLTV